MAGILGSQGSWVICQMAYQPLTGEMERTRDRILDLVTHLENENHTKGVNHSKASVTAQDLNSRTKRQRFRSGVQGHPLKPQEFSQTYEGGA